MDNFLELKFKLVIQALAMQEQDCGKIVSIIHYNIIHHFFFLPFISSRMAMALI